MPYQQEIRILNKLDDLAHHRVNLVNLTAEQGLKDRWENNVSKTIDWTRNERLQGGLRNIVVMNTESKDVTIYWWASSVRWPQILRAVMLEDHIARNTDLGGRELVDPEKPIEVNEDGFFITRTKFLEGRYRHPWTMEDIYKAGKFMAKLHNELAMVTFDDQIPANGTQILHGDFLGGNVIFSGKEIYCAIDYENLTISVPPYDIGHTCAYILANSVPEGVNDYPQEPILDHDYESHTFSDRFEAFLNGYGETFNRRQAVNFTLEDLSFGVFGKANPIRDRAVKWLSKTMDDK